MGGLLPLPIMHISTGKCSIINIISTGIRFKIEFSHVMAKRIYNNNRSEKQMLAVMKNVK